MFIEGRKVPAAPQREVPEMTRLLNVQ